MARLNRRGVLTAGILSGASFTGLLMGAAQIIARDEMAGIKGALATDIGLWATACVMSVLAATLIWSFRHYYLPSHACDHLLSKNGVLHFHKERHIAFNVETIKSILSSLARFAPAGSAKNVLYESGVEAGKRFGGVFRDIYIDQIQPTEHKNWDHLSNNEKLDVWERYDGDVGWGKISAFDHEDAKFVEVKFQHPTLFRDEGGALFAWLLAGYAKEVASAILRRELHFVESKGFKKESELLDLQYGYGHAKAGQAASSNSAGGKFRRRA